MVIYTDGCYKGASRNQPTCVGLFSSELWCHGVSRRCLGNKIPGQSFGISPVWNSVRLCHVWAVQAGCFVPFATLCCNCYASFVSSKFIQRHALKFQLLILTAIVILSLDVFLSLNFVSVYGRRQLLFGVDHPKEQALLILFFFYTFWGPIQRGKLRVIFSALVLYLLFLTDARASLLGFMVFLFSYQFGFRNALSLGALLVLALILVLALGSYDTDAINRFASNRLMLWFELFANGRNVVISNSIDSSWLELGRNGTVFICLMVPFLIVVLAALLDLSKDNSIYNRTVCAMGLHYLSRIHL